MQLTSTFVEHAGPSQHQPTPQVTPRIVDERLHALCCEVLSESIASRRFHDLLLDTGLQLHSWEWDVIQRLLGKTDEMLSTLGRSQRMRH